jgi:S-disulfanyl-L-cysteine oxidoreductase SoxD
MPYQQPRSLTPEETYALVAFFLAENGVVPRDAVMDARSLAAVRMPMRDRFVRDDRTGGSTFR